MILSPNDVLDRGLEIMNIRRGRKNEKRLLLEFHKHYGSSPLDIAECWYDLCYFHESVLSPKEKSDKGFKHILAAQHWLWARPKNAEMFASRFGMCIDYVQGKRLWLWIQRIANLAEKKIVWDKSINSQDTQVLALSGKLLYSKGSTDVCSIKYCKRCLGELKAFRQTPAAI
jgi:hypothetical protein